MGVQGNVICNNTMFIDPEYRVRKSCYCYQDDKPKIDKNDVQFQQIKQTDPMPRGWTDATWEYVLTDDAISRDRTGSGNSGTNDLMPNVVRAASAIRKGIYAVERG